MDERTALVTGAAHGIGRGYAHALGSAGATVVLADIDGDGAATAAKELSEQGLDARPMAVDVADADSVRDEVEALGEPIDVLINNATIFATVPMSRAGYLDLTVEGGT